MSIHFNFFGSFNFTNTKSLKKFNQHNESARLNSDDTLDSSFSEFRILKGSIEKSPTTSSRQTMIILSDH